MCSLNTGSSTGCRGACQSVSVYRVGAHAPACIFLCTHFRGRETCSHLLMNFAIDSRHSINMQPVHLLSVSTHVSLCDWSRNVLVNVVYKCAITSSTEAQNLTYFVWYVQLCSWEVERKLGQFKHWRFKQAEDLTKPCHFLTALLRDPKCRPHR